LSFHITTSYRGWGIKIKGGKNLKPRLKKHGLLIIAIILLIALSTVTYSYLSETKLESQQALIQKDADTDVETIASVSKSTAILIVCVGFAGLLSVRRKKIK
jgi:hypothetical protein